MPPLPADSIHARACKLKCEKILTRPNQEDRCGECIPAAALLLYKGERDLPSVSWADPSCFYVCSHAAIFFIFARTSAGPSIRMAPPKVNTHEKNGGVGATSTVARKCLVSTTSVATSSPKWSMTFRMVRFSHSSITRRGASWYIPKTSRR